MRHGLRHGGAVGALVAEAPAARLLLPHGREANVQPTQRRHPPATIDFNTDLGQITVH